MNILGSKTAAAMIKSLAGLRTRRHTKRQQLQAADADIVASGPRRLERLRVKQSQAHTEDKNTRASTDAGGACACQDNGRAVRENSKETAAVMPLMIPEECTAPLFPGTVKQAAQSPLSEQGLLRFTATLADRLKSDLPLETQKLLSKDQVLRILAAATILLRALPNILDVSLPAEKDQRLLTIVGDTHGNLRALLDVFAQRGYPSSTNQFVFNGDYVDRGRQGFEVLLLLVCFKLLHPTTVHLLRGNHESEEVNMAMERLGCASFFSEVLDKYDQQVYDAFTRLFSSLPLAAVITDARTQERVFVCHGGLPLTAKAGKPPSLKCINKIDRAANSSVIMYEMLNNDPHSEALSWEEHCAGSRGGGSLSFGLGVTAKFLSRNNCDLLIRSHECVPGGHRTCHKLFGIHRCHTILTDPSHCRGRGAILAVDQDKGLVDGLHPVFIYDWSMWRYYSETLLPEREQGEKRETKAKDEGESRGGREQSEKMEGESKAGKRLRDIESSTEDSVQEVVVDCDVIVEQVEEREWREEKEERQKREEKSLWEREKKEERVEKQEKWEREKSEEINEDARKRDEAEVAGERPSDSTDACSHERKDGEAEEEAHTREAVESEAQQHGEVERKQEDTDSERVEANSGERTQASTPISPFPGSFSGGYHSNGRPLFTGPLGGIYYVTDLGRRQYVNAAQSGNSQ